MNYLLGLLVAAATTSPIALNSPTSPVEASSVETCVPMPKEQIYAKIVHYSALYGVSEGMMDYIVKNESSYRNCIDGDHFMPSPSVGLTQISLHYWPDITREQAEDVDFSLDFLASKLSDGKCRLWTTCRAFQKSLARRE
jgi:hypothetical protein